VLATGAFAVARALVPRCGADHETRDSLARDAARIGWLACCVLTPASALRLADQVQALQTDGDSLLAGLRALLFSTTWGTGFLAQSAAILLALIGFGLAIRLPGSPTRWVCAGLGVAGLCITPAMQGHAIGSENYTLLAVVADIMHVSGAGLWIGSISVIAWLGFHQRTVDGSVVLERSARADGRLRLLVPLVPPLALSGAALLVLSGATMSLLQLRSISDLWNTQWGLYVAGKIVLVLIVIALGALNWRRLGRRLDQLSGMIALRRALVVEIAMAAVVLLVTALLVVTPLPGE
jgi:putative copper export protein